MKFSEGKFGKLRAEQFFYPLLWNCRPKGEGSANLSYEPATAEQNPKDFEFRILAIQY